VWGVVGLVVVGSVVLHGLSATPVMAMLDRRRVEVGGEQASTTPV
jgi:NhaP-type Na+/H+ or K+/H+ antiporter